MDPTGWGLVAFVVLLSGALSYYGDVLGRKLGKKRLTVGRLRPRHTAAMMTALFGMLGSAIAIWALTVFSTPVRVMLFEGAKIRADLASTKHDLLTARSDLDNRQKELENTKLDVKNEKRKVAEETTKLTLAQKDVDALRESAKKLNFQTSRIRADLQSVRGQLTKLNAEYAVITRDKKNTEKLRDYAVEKYNEQLKHNAAAEMAFAKQQLEAQKKIDDLQGQYGALKHDFDLLTEEYAKQAEIAKKDIGSLRAQVEEAKNNLENANRELAFLRNQANEIIRGAVENWKFQPLIFSRDEELARLPIRANLNLAEARSQVFALLEQASAAAKEGGASKVLGGNSYVQLPPGFDKNKNPIPEDAQIQTFIQQILNVNREQLLIANTFFNAFKGEAVALTIRVLPNPVIYKKDQIIVETKIDGTMTQDQIVVAITKFLQEQLAPKAIKDGMIPAIGQPNPLGEVSQQDLLNLVTEIKSHQFTSRVKVQATQDIRAGDKLKVEFRVS